MRITPLDVRKQEFRKAVRGYDTDEVRGFLTTLAEEYETVLVDNKTLRENIAKQEEKLVDYQQLEKTLRDTLMTAQRVMQDTKDNATREGKMIVQEAHQQAQLILTESRQRTEELRREILFLRKEKDTYLARFRLLAQAQIQFVDTHESDFAAADNRLTEMADSVVGETRPVLPPSNFQPIPVGTNPPAGQGTKIRGEDVWRDYSPLAPETGIGTETNLASSPEPSAGDVVDSTEQVVSTMAAAVEMASKGIPVEAVASAEPTVPKAVEDPAIKIPTTEEIVVPV